MTTHCFKLDGLGGRHRRVTRTMYAVAHVHPKIVFVAIQEFGPKPTKRLRLAFHMRLLDTLPTDRPWDILFHGAKDFERFPAIHPADP